MDNPANQAPPAPPPGGPVSDAAPPPPPTDAGNTGGSSVVSTTPKRGMNVSGKLIATVLGILFLVGGVGAGIFLVQQNQDVREKAASQCPDGSGDAIWCATWNCPNGDTNGDGQCTSDDGGNITIGTSCSPPSSGCGQIDWYNAGPQGQNFGAFCGTSFHQFTENCGGGSGAGGRDYECNVKVKASSSYCSTDEILITANWNFLKELGTNHSAKSGWVGDSLETERANTGGVTKKDLGDGWKRVKIKRVFRVLNPTPGSYTYQATGQLAFPDGGKVNCDDQKTFTVQDCTPSTPPICQEIKIYDTSWNQLTFEQIETMGEGATLRFAVKGSAITGTFDKAIFTINNTPQPEVTQLSPNNEFYVEYTLPAGTTNFSVGAIVHHVETDAWY